MNEIANQHNDLIDLPLRRFNSSEIDILHAICYKCQNEGSKEIVLPFEQIRKLSHYQAKDDNRFYKDIESMGDKLFSLHFKIGTEREFTKFVLFPTYKVSEDEQTLTVKVNEDFTYLFNELTGNYTSLELQQSSQLKSTYSKQIYKELKRFKGTGKWIVSLEDFKNYLDVPKSFKIGHIDDRIIKPSIEELSPYFQGLKCEKKYKKSSSGRGRPSVVGYEFLFKQEIKEKYKNMDTLATATDWKKIDKYCPICHKEVYSKELHNENGTYYILGHPDFKTGGCDWTSTSWSDVLTKEQIKNVKNKDDKLETIAKQKENKKKLSEKLKGIFK